MLPTPTDHDPDKFASTPTNSYDYDLIPHPIEPRISVSTTCFPELLVLLCGLALRRPFGERPHDRQTACDDAYGRELEAARVVTTQEWDVDGGDGPMERASRGRLICF